MARRRSAPPDHYERAAASMDAERRRRDLGDPIPDLPPSLAPSIDDRRLRRTLGLVAVAFGVLVVGRLATQHADAPDSCTRSELHLGSGSALAGDPVTWSGSGRPGSRLRLAVDGRPVTAAQPVRSCRVSGLFAAPAGAGRHRITLVGTGGGVLARATLQVRG